MKKTLILGTAQWGWTVSRQEAFQLLDAWIGSGGRELDCATNYPINRDPAVFRAAEKILHEYVHAHGLQDIRLTMKIGSLDNMRSPEVNLAPSFIQMMAEEYLRLFGTNLSCIMLHWDNRADVSAIRASLEALQLLQQTAGIRPGLSGIAHPEAYMQANADLRLSFDIQLKHNVLQSDFERYGPLRNDATDLQHRFFAYGLNAGGVKLESDYARSSTFLARGGQTGSFTQKLDKLAELLPEWNTAYVRPPLITMNHLGLIYAGLHPRLSGLLLGVSSVAQLRETLDYWRNLGTFDYADVFSALNTQVP